MNSEAESTVGTNLNNVRDYIETDNLESQSTENQHWKAVAKFLFT
jgi:hypothetical protein